MPQLYDMHCHLDFADNCEEIAAQTTDSIQAICSTVIPSSFVIAREKFAPYPHIRPALGLHPWWVAQGRVGEVDIARFGHLVDEVGIIGEIGLDFSSKMHATKDVQMKVFMRLLDYISQTEDPRLIFLHVVNAYDEVISLMDRTNTFNENTCVLHWFSGCNDSFVKLLSRNCMFSVSTRMLYSGAGAMFAKSIPDKALLLETDHPSQTGDVWSAEAWKDELARTIRSLADLRNVSVEHISEVVARNSAALLREYDIQPTMI